jgi:hypothetical protein
MNVFYGPQDSILDLLEIELHNFIYLFIMKLSQSHNSNSEFKRSVKIELSCFFICFFISSFIIGLVEN